MAANTVRRQKARANVAQFVGECGEFGGAPGLPFYRVRLPREVAFALLQALQESSSADDRSWFTLTATADQASRLRLTRNLRTPAFEVNAARSYLRGEIFRVSGTPRKSCNIDFSAAVGAELLADRLASSSQRMRKFIALCIRSRSRNVVEFIPDAELEGDDSLEHQSLGRTGEALAIEVWPREDFGDWNA